MNEAQFLISLGMKPKPINSTPKKGELSMPMIHTPVRTDADTERKKPEAAE